MPILWYEAEKSPKVSTCFSAGARSKRGWKNAIKSLWAVRRSSYFVVL